MSQKDQALEDWVRALWEQLQDQPSTEKAWDIIRENADRLLREKGLVKSDP